MIAAHARTYARARAFADRPQEVSSFDEAGAVGPSSSPSVYVYAARYTTGLPFQAPLTTLVKEYSPAARAVALNELLILSHLCGLPSDKWLVSGR